MPPACLIDQQGKLLHLASEEGIEIYLEQRGGPAPAEAKRVLLIVAGDDVMPGEAVAARIAPDDAVYVCQSRGIGPTRWTQTHPHYVLRAHVLLGRTVDTGRLWDIIAAARYLENQSSQKGRIHVVGEGDSAALAAYAGLLEPDIAGVMLASPLLTHADAKAPSC